MQEIKQAFEELNKTVLEMRAEIDKAKGSSDPVALEKIEKLNAAIGELDAKHQELHKDMLAEKQLVEELEGRLSSNKSGFSEIDQKRNEHRELFVKWFRSRGPEFGTEAEQLKAFEKKDVTGTVPASGGFAVPEVIGSRIAEFQKLYSPIRQVARVVTTGTSDYKELVDIGGEDCGWIGETGTRTGTNTPSLRERAPTNGTLYAYPKATEESLDDIFFNVENWLSTKVAKQMARVEGEAFVLGDGTNKPTGFLNGTHTAISDEGSPTRGAEALQYVNSGAATALTGDGLIDLVYSLNSFHRAMGTFVMNSATTGAVRKLKDQQDQYLWAPGLQAGEPARLLGYPSLTVEGMPDIAASAYPIAFGDFEEGYLIADRVGLRISVDNNLTTPGYVKWYIRKRVGGILLNNNAIKLQRVSL